MSSELSTAPEKDTPSRDAASVVDVEDGTSDRDLLVAVLGQAGYVVLEGTTDEPPSGAARSEGHDLAIADVTVPSQDGPKRQTHREQFQALNDKLLQEVDELRDAVVRAGALHAQLGLNGQHVAGVVGSTMAPGSGAEHVLSPRELQVLAMIAEGAPNSEIAGRLVIAETTVQSHVQHILHKLGVRNRTEAAGRYLRRS
jgi:DNA-binding CsgD family transcriptional regulator